MFNMLRTLLQLQRNFTKEFYKVHLQKRITMNIRNKKDNENKKNNENIEQEEGVYGSYVCVER